MFVVTSMLPRLVIIQAESPGLQYHSSPTSMVVVAARAPLPDMRARADKTRRLEPAAASIKARDIGYLLLLMTSGYRRNTALEPPTDCKDLEKLRGSPPQTASRLSFHLEGPEGGRPVN